ncbi:MAG: hypothetical protein CML13_16015 [Puniceicoccaceae bacterium]|nr:hypothetical protein [Puniceicoccaceae bacterium]|tara:strand:+ start:9061 stop:9897 length:837 start_codon:yes stop_codon:yes gene_type:complete
MPLELKIDDFTNAQPGKKMKIAMAARGATYRELHFTLNATTNGTTVMPFTTLIPEIKLRVDGDVIITIDTAHAKKRQALRGINVASNSFFLEFAEVMRNTPGEEDLFALGLADRKSFLVEADILALTGSQTFDSITGYKVFEPVDTNIGVHRVNEIFPETGVKVGWNLLRIDSPQGDILGIDFKSDKVDEIRIERGNSTIYESDLAHVRNRLASRPGWVDTTPDFFPYIPELSMRRSDRLYTEKDDGTPLEPLKIWYHTTGAITGNSFDVAVDWYKKS